MKVNTSVVACLCYLLLCASPCSGQELIKDPHFENGFKLTPLDPQIVRKNGGFDRSYQDTLNFGTRVHRPVWRLAQWHSAYSLANAGLHRGVGGGAWYADKNQSKKIAVDADHSLLLELNASKDYDRPRVKGEQWPHLLIAQDFGKNSPNLGEVASLQFSMQLKLEKCENKMEAGAFDPALHTAHTPLFFVLRNANKASADFGQKIWFGIRSYDYRQARLSKEEKVSWDIGTQTYIYNVPPRRIWDDVTFHDKKWHKTRIDLKPFLIQALQTMKAKGVFQHSQPSDLVLTGMNFGWEIPGTFDAAVRVKGISLVVAGKRDKKTSLLLKK